MLRKKLLKSVQRGLSLVELMVALLLLGLLIAGVVVSFRRYERANAHKKFVSSLNLVVGQAWQQAIASNTVHRLLFDLKKRTISLEKKTDQFDARGEPAFKPVSLVQPGRVYEWPERFEIVHFLINGVDVFRAGYLPETAWCYVMPEGTAQPVTMVVVDKQEQFQHEARQFSLVLNPFMPQFEEHEAR